jgi:hypothetical protein
VLSAANLSETDIVSRFSFFRRLKNQKPAIANRETMATAPITPPAIAPVEILFDGVVPEMLLDAEDGAETTEGVADSGMLDEEVVEEDVAVADTVLKPFI